MSERKSVEEQIALLERNASAWLEPMRKWIQDAQMLGEILKTDDLPSKKTSLQKIFGSNLTLQAREARGVPMNPWVFLDEGKQKLGKIPVSSILVLGRGLEPPSLAAYEPQSYAYTNSATRANRRFTSLRAYASLLS